MNKLGWTLVAALAGIALGVILGREPWKEYQAMRQDSHDATAEARKLENERAELLHENARFDSPAGMEEIARSRGYRPADEKPIELDK